MRSPQRHGLSWVLLFSAVFLGYFVGGRLAFSLLSVSGLGAVFFAPAGVTVAALVLVPLRRWAIVLLAAASAEWLLGFWLGDYSLLGQVGFIVANLAEPIVAATVVRWILGARPDLTTTRDLAIFVGSVGLMGPLVGASIGSAAAVNENAALGYASTFVQWWLGDALGAVLVGSVIVACWGTTSDRRALWSFEGSLLLVGAAAAAFAAYWATDLDVGFVLLVGAVTAGVRFGTKSVSLISLLIATIALTSLPATGDFSLRSGFENDEALVVIKLEFLAFAIAGLLVAAEAAERDRTAERRAIDQQAVHHLQQALLPVDEIAGPSFTAAGCYRAAGTLIDVGGDWYDVSETSGGIVSIAVGDVVGHGTDAVAAMGQIRFAVAGLAAAGLSPGQVLTELDRRVSEMPVAMGSSAWVAQYDTQKRTLTYSSAGHPPALLCVAGGDWEWLDQARATLLGYISGPRPEQTKQVEQATIWVYTDGAVERRSESLDVGLTRLQQALAHNVEATPHEILESVAATDRFDDAVLVRIDLHAAR